MPWKFSFYDQHGLKFREDVERMRCVAHSSDGHQCKNICVIGDPYCWIHLLYKKHLRIKTSRIQGAGKGCFVMDKKRPANAIIFRKDEDILFYDGEVVTKQTLNQRYGRHTAPYGVEVNRGRNIYEDGATERSAMACVNSPPPGIHANCRLTTDVQRNNCKIKANRDIRNGEELYASYGPSYRMGNNGPTHYDTRYFR